MATPGIITGSNSATALFRATGTGTEAGTKLGVFGQNPGATPKYAINAGSRDAESRETMARLFVEVPSQLNTFLASISPETQALARVLATGGNSAGSGGTGFLDFLLTGAQEGFAEKAQIVDTLTDNFVAFYSGQAPPLFQYSGTLLNTYQDDQRVWMFRLYREILRGTRLAGRNLIARLRYDSFIVSGYLESLNMSISGDTDHQAGQFQFSMRVQHMTVFTQSIGAPTIASTPATETSTVTSAVTTSDPSTERVATIAPELDLATQEAVRDSVAQTDPRQALRDRGVPDAAIDALLALQSAAETLEQVREFDPREAAARAAGGASAWLQDALTAGDAAATGAITQATLDAQQARVDAQQAAVDVRAQSIAQVASAIGAVTNPLNEARDGLGGITNVLGDIYGTAFGTDSSDGNSFTQELPEREGLRRRGGLDATTSP